MNVLIDYYRSSHAIDRITKALLKYVPPGINFVPNEQEAEIAIIFVTGRHDHIAQRASDLTRAGKKYVIVQLSLLSTNNPRARDWFQIWEGAKLVWSYYDLKQYCKNFYHSPLGSDPESFYPILSERKYAICTVGNYFDAECLWDAWEAARYVQKKAAHIGRRVINYSWIDFHWHIKDEELNQIYNQSSYISGLRTKEGFEIPAVEGLLCGVKPILFDTPNFRQWYDGLALFIPEDDNIFENLVRILEDESKGVSSRVRQEVIERFNWNKILFEFWERLCG